MLLFTSHGSSAINRIPPHQNWHFASPSGHGVERTARRPGESPPGTDAFFFFLFCLALATPQALVSKVALAEREVKSAEAR